MAAELANPSQPCLGNSISTPGITKRLRGHADVAIDDSVGNDPVQADL